MHYWRKNNALQTLGVPWPAAAGPPGPGGHYFFTNNALAGILIIVLYLKSGEGEILILTFLSIAALHITFRLHRHESQSDT